MAVNLRASDPASSAGKPARESAAALLQAAREQLGGEWKMVSSRLKMRKTLFEADYNGRCVIGKMSRSRNAQTAFASLRKLWDAGMRPPSRYTVTEPLAWIAEHSLLVQERAPGVSMLDVLERREDIVAHARDAAAWLRCLWSLRVEADIVHFEADDVARRAAALSRAISDERIEEMARRVADVLSTAPAEHVPSHGDFHPLNVFVSPDRVTAIDLDTFACRERELDVAYFLAQLANFGLQVHGTFAGTQAARDAFLEACGPVNEPRVAAHMAWTLLGSLHYDACILKLRSEKLSTMIEAAARLLDHGSLD
jgi:thiamine kinase-like enzyme